MESELGPNHLEREKAIAKALDTVSISDYDRADFIWIMKGLKPATEIQIWTSDKGSKRELDCQKFETLCRDAGIFFEKLAKWDIGHSPAHLDSGRPVYAVAKVRKNLETLLFLLRRKHVDSKMSGSIYGFPETAVEAFSTLDNEKLVSWDHKDLPLQARYEHEDVLPFVWFILSKDNWRQELEEVRKKAEIIKKLAPSLYTQLVAEYKQTRRT